MEAALQNLIPIFQVAGSAIIFWSLIKGISNVMRGYPGGVGQMIGGVGVGLMVIVMPRILPTIESTFLRALDPDYEPKADKPEPADPTPTSGDSTGTSDIDLAEVLPVFAIIVGVILVIGLIVAVVMGVNHQRRKAAEQRAAAERARIEEETRLDRVWVEAVERHDIVREEMMRHRTDIDLVLSMPAINDEHEPKTAAFTDALARAVDLAHDARPSSAEAVETYAKATRDAERAWAAAWRNADRIRLSHFSADERSRIKTVTNLLKRAETETTAEARRAYYQRAMKTLDHLIEIPAPAVEAIEQRVAGVLANPAADSDITYHSAPSSLDASILSNLARKARAKVTR